MGPTLKLLLFFLTAFIFNLSVNGQQYLRITDLKNSKITIIQPGSLVQCYYQFTDTKKLLVFGEVDKILDSTFSIRTRGVIPYATISGIDKPTVKRLLFPAAIIGLLTGGISVLTKSNNDLLANEGLFIGGGASLSLLCTFALNRKKIQQNVIGKRVNLELVKNAP